MIDLLTIASGSVIRCDVEIDVIDSIEIITTTREIVLEDLPEILEVKAKNDKSIQLIINLFDINFMIIFQTTPSPQSVAFNWNGLSVPSMSSGLYRLVI